MKWLVGRGVLLAGVAAMLAMLWVGAHLLTFSPSAKAETCTSQGLCYEQVIKTSYGYRILLDQGQAQDWAERMENAASVCDLLGLVLPKPAKTGCKISMSGMATAEQIRQASARSAMGAVEYGVAIVGKAPVASLVRPWHGGIDLDGYCRQLGHRGVVLKGQSVYGWKCQTGDGRLVGMEVDAACVASYGAGSSSQFFDERNPYSWYCVGQTIGK